MQRPIPASVPETAFDNQSLSVLCVDLDGTLVRSDTLAESLIALTYRNPMYISLLPIWLCAAFLIGKSGLHPQSIRSRDRSLQSRLSQVFAG